MESKGATMQYAVLIGLCLVALAECTSRARTGFYVNNKKTRAVHVYREGRLLTRCSIYGDSKNINELLTNTEIQDNLRFVDDKQMTSFVNWCSQVEIPHLWFRGPNMRNLKAIIYPGTKWCGAGDVAEDYDDLGEYWETDMCCRAHDHCPDHIPRGEEKYGLVNNNMGTVSHCDCDEEFSACLRKTNNKVSNNVGALFLNALGMPCFRRDYPIVKCLEWGGSSGKRCQVYELDHSQPKIWQFFDAKEYKPSRSI